MRGGLEAYWLLGSMRCAVFFKEFNPKPSAGATPVKSASLFLRNLTGRAGQAGQGKLEAES
jgi:hypothetical protein